jgi:hypothetical protein
MKISVWFPVFIAVLFSSCASIFNGSTHRMTITTNAQPASVRVNSVLAPSRNGKAKIWVTRDKQPLTISLKTNDTTYTFRIKSRNSFNYLIGLAYTAGISALAERNNPKRYY